MTTKTDLHTLTASTPKNPNMRCTLSVSPQFSANLTPESPLHPDTAAYAARRFLARCRPAQDWLVPQSYQLRVSKRSRRRSTTLWVQLDPVVFTLPAGSAAVYLRLTVDATGVTVEQVRLLPPGAPAPRRVDAAFGLDSYRHTALRP